MSDYSTFEYCVSWFTMGKIGSKAEKPTYMKQTGKIEISEEESGQIVSGDEILDSDLILRLYNLRN